MLRSRLAVAVVLVPTILLSAYAGGLIYLALLLLVFGVAAAEYVRLFRGSGARPSLPLVLGGTIVVLLAHAIDGQRLSALAFSLLAVLALAWHLVAFERGAAPTAGTDFAVSVAGVVLLGTMGGTLVLLRELQDGAWWTLLVLPAVWLTDSGAYMIGRRYGRHAMAPRLSPKKTWEGFVGGLVGGTLGGALLGTVWHMGAGPQSAVTTWSGLWIGLAVATLSPIGDLGISMIKRQAGIKDAGHVLGGHGGMLDRLDTVLVASVVGYYGALWSLHLNT